MNKTKIDWATMSWNPVTGCLHRCPYCYANRQAERFSGYDPLYNTNFDFESGCYIIKKPMYKRYATGIVRKAPFPFEFAPTFHKYRLDEPAKKKKPQVIFVGSMCDLFGDWVPDGWILRVFEACKEAPHHRYLFLTKNPERYLNLYYKGKLPEQSNFWYGATITNQVDYERVWRRLGNLPLTYNIYFSIEPIHGEINLGFMPPWIIIGAETGNRKDKKIPKREWIESIVLACTEEAVFMKESLRPVWGDNLIQKYPWGDDYVLQK